jgi:hypothetical protein
MTLFEVDHAVRDLDRLTSGQSVSIAPGHGDETAPKAELYDFACSQVEF